MRSLIVDEARCFGCRACSSVCPASLIQLEEADGVRSILFAGICVEECVLCRDACPQEAIAFEEVGQEREGVRLRFPLRRCDRCGEPFAPERLLEALPARLEEALGTAEAPWVGLCPGCRREQAAVGLLQPAVEG